MTPIMIMAAGGMVMLALVALAFAGPSAERASAKRLAAVRERHSGSATVAVEAKMRRITATRGGRMDDAVTRFLPNPALLKKRLAMTGKSWTLSQYMMTSGAIAVGLAGVLSSEGLPFFLALVIGLFVGIGVPHFIVGFLIKRRVAKFTVKFPDAIELLVRGLRSGLPITETITVVAAEIDGPVGEEFRSVSDKMKIGRTLDAALQETADRLGTPEFQFFTITIQIQRETGGNLAETLANLATVLRQRSRYGLHGFNTNSHSRPPGSSTRAHSCSSGCGSPASSTCCSTITATASVGSGSGRPQRTCPVSRWAPDLACNRRPRMGGMSPAGAGSTPSGETQSHGPGVLLVSAWLTRACSEARTGPPRPVPNHARASG